MKRVALLGSTGSIGTQTLDVIRRLNAHESQFEVDVLVAGRNVERLAQQIREFRPRAVAIRDERDVAALRAQLDPQTEAPDILSGADALTAVVRESSADLVVNGLVGAVGLPPTLVALEAGIDVALANKESLVIGGPLVQRARAGSDADLIPIDSEHSALFQLLANAPSDAVSELILTASGGALRDVPLEELNAVTPRDVLAHPTWAMGARITVDSATLVNKAFEVIEAHWLFRWPYESIRAVIHPQSVVHGMIGLVDGGVRAALSPPNMREPIQYALTYPERASQVVHELDWNGLRLDFRALETTRYPAFEVVVEAGRQGGTAPAAANAADEVLVERFLSEEIPYSRIASGLREVVQDHDALSDFGLDELWAADRWARERARAIAAHD